MTRAGEAISGPGSWLEAATQAMEEVRDNLEDLRRLPRYVSGWKRNYPLPGERITLVKEWELHGDTGKLNLRAVVQVAELAWPDIRFYTVERG